MSALDRFAKLLGIRPDLAEDAMASERVARHVLSRRSFFGASAALASGAVFSFGAPKRVLLAGIRMDEFTFYDDASFPRRYAGRWIPAREVLTIVGVDAAAAVVTCEYRVEDRRSMATGLAPSVRIEGR